MFRLLRVAVLLLVLPASIYAQCDYGITVTKSADHSAAVIGLEVVYTIEVTNVSECPVYLDHVLDNLLGDLTGWFMPVLEPGVSETYSYPHIVQPGDPDPLVNTVTAAYSDDVGNTYEASADAVVNIVHPSANSSLICMPGQFEPDVVIEFILEVTNTGDVALIVTLEWLPALPDPLEPVEIPPGSSFAVYYDGLCEEGIACSQVSIVATLRPELGLDFSLEGFEEECCECLASPVERGSWGMIKALYRGQASE